MQYIVQTTRTVQSTEYTYRSEYSAHVQSRVQSKCAAKSIECV